MTTNEKSLYFGTDVDEAIVGFFKEADQKKRSKLFEMKIYPAFEKLAQYHYHNLPVARNPDVIIECVSFLYEQLHKFDPTKSSRGFPYFNQITKHWFIGRIKSEKKELLQDQDINVSLNDSNSTCSETLAIDNFEDQIESDQFIKIFKQHLPLWRDKFTKAHEKQLVDALVVLFESADDIDIYKKKALFFYLKEITHMNAKQVAINLNKIKKKFMFLKARYDRGDF
jgi:hypothetical protein